MTSFFGGDFDALCIPLTSGGDEGSVEQSKEANPSLVDAGNVTEMANPNGDTNCGSIVQVWKM